MPFSHLERIVEPTTPFSRVVAHGWLVAAMLFVLVLAGSPRIASAASYQQTDGTIVDPILYGCCTTPDGEPHPYSGVDLAPGADLFGANLSSADLRNADLRTASLIVADFRGATLSNADLRGANLTATNLRNADLSGANLSGNSGYGGNLNFANLTGAVWVGGIADEMSLGGANLSFADLRGWTASEAGVGGASFVHANLDGSYLAVLGQNADFTYASLRGARFDFIADTPTNLTGANFFGADLTGASFDSEYLGIPGLDQLRISLSDTDFSNAVLLDVVGLGNTVGVALYDSGTDFTNAWVDLDATIPFDPVAAGWTLIPEPGTALLVGLGLAGLATERRARRGGLDRE